MFVLIKRLFSFAPFIGYMDYNEKQIQIMEAAEKLWQISAQITGEDLALPGIRQDYE